MAVFRVEKNHNYTVMSNYHLRDTGLTLKAIGLLSKMLSLTDEWDYTTRGLAAICKEGVDAIGAALKELEVRGYLVRRQIRDSKGRITDTEYTIYESPHTPLPDTASPDTENPYLDKPLRTAHAGDVAVSKAPRSALYASGLDIWIRLFSEMPHQAKAQSISPRAFRFIRSRNPHCRRPRR